MPRAQPAARRRRPSLSARIDVRPGQIYRARAPRRARYVRIQRVAARKHHTPFVTAREVSQRGTRVRGKDRYGLSRRAPLRIALTWRGSVWGMPPGYQLLDAASAASSATRRRR